jgi:acetyl-CoA carboxylase carboxyl transferase subunit alpha
MIDRIVSEPPGGAHRDHDAMMQNLRKALQDAWRQLKERPIEELLDARLEKLIGHGKFKEVQQR